MNKHTPGPWFVDLYGDVQANGEDVARVVGGGGFDQTQANADLIAAAPTMLEALQHISANGYSSIADLDMVLDAIAKACGEQEIQITPEGRAIAAAYKKRQEEANGHG